MTISINTDEQFKIDGEDAYFDPAIVGKVDGASVVLAIDDPSQGWHGATCLITIGWHEAKALGEWLVDAAAKARK